MSQAMMSPEMAMVLKDSLHDISERSFKLRHRKTPPELISERVGPAGKMLKYVKPSPIYEWLDANYPGWSMEVSENFKELANYVYVTVTLKVIEPSGITRTISRQGCDEAIISPAKGLTASPYLKSAETDALKRCVMALGGFADVYMDTDTSDELVSDEDLKWYVDIVLPYITAKDTVNYRGLFRQMKAFLGSVITKTELVERFKDLPQ